MSQALAYSAAAPHAVAHDAMLDDLEPLPGTRALVIGRHTLETMCGLIRRGCVGATEIRPGEHAGPAPEPVQVVVLADPASLTEGAAAVAVARRALGCGGRIVIRDTRGLRRRELAALLRTQGFVSVCTHFARDGALILGIRPAPPPCA